MRPMQKGLPQTMTLADTLVLFVAVASLGVGAFVVVNHARLIAPLLKSAGQFNEAVANFALMQERQVEARIALLNTKLPVREPFGMQQRTIPQTGEPPLPGDEPNFVDQFSAPEHEASHHPRRNERDAYDDLSVDSLTVQR